MTATMTKEATEQELRTQIAKLECELASKRTERAHLIRQRIDLLQRELPTESE